MAKTWNDYKSKNDKKTWADYQKEYSPEVAPNTNAFRMFSDNSPYKKQFSKNYSAPSNQKMIDLQNSVLSQPDNTNWWDEFWKDQDKTNQEMKQTQAARLKNIGDKPWLEDMFGKTTPDVLFNQGDIGGGIASVVGGAINVLPSTFFNLYNEATNYADQVAKNKSLEYAKIKPRQWVYNMNFDDSQKEERDRFDPGGKTINEAATDVNPYLGIAVSTVGEILTDPTNLLPFGMYDDIARALKASTPGSVNYARQLVETAQQQLAKAPLRMPGEDFNLPQAAKLELPKADLPQLPNYAPSKLPQVDNIQGALPGMAKQAENLPVPSASVVRPVKATGNLPVYNSSLYAKNTVGAAQAADKPTLDQLAKQYGAFDKGEAPRMREIAVPKETEYGKTSRFVRTALESDIPEEAVTEIKKEIANGTFSYVPIKDVEAQAKANKVISDNGLDAAYTQWKAVVNGTKTATKDDIALGETLLKQAADAGDVNSVVDLVADLAAEGTRAGQNIQAMRMLKKMTPAGQLVGVQKFVDKLNKDLSAKLGTKFNKINIGTDSPAVKELLASKDTKATEIAMDKLFQEVADQIPSSWEDKWNAWRYFAMLGNPKTHIRNIIGNAILVPVRKFKDLIGTWLEKMARLPQADRTKAILTPKDKPLVQFAKDDFTYIEGLLKGSGKMNPSTAINEKRTIYKNKLLEWGRKTNSKLLDAEDTWFLKGAYTDSLAQAAKARGYTPEFLKADTKVSKEALETIRQYAFDEALKATYRDASEFSTWLNKVKKTVSSKAPGRILAEGILPFSKTPANILQRGLEYSPAGLIKSLTADIVRLKTNKITGTQYVDNLAKGLTGTGIFGLGAWLASMGLITGSSAENKKQDQFETLQGEQNYAINIGNSSYTIDWATPISLPLFVGVETYNAVSDGGSIKNFTSFLDAISNINEPLFNLSMLQGVNDSIKSISNGKSAAEGAADSVINSAFNYAGQGIPTALGQTARTIDNTRRTTYTDKTSFLPQASQYPIERNLAKIPFANQALQPKIDQWGRKDVEPNPAVRAFENFASPGYISKNNSTEVDKEVKRLYNYTSDNAVLPSYAPKYFTVNGERKDLTAEEYTEFAEKKGQNAYAYLADIIKNSDYKSLSDADKAEVIKSAYDYSNAKAKTAVSAYQLDGWYEKAKAAEDKGIEIADYLLYKAYLPVSANQQEAQQALNETDLTTSQKAYMWALQNKKWKNNPFK